MDSKPTINSICVDASCRGNPGPTEYRGVDLLSGKQLFQRGYSLGTNNIGEFLAICHALAYIKHNGLERKYSIVYSDSLTAIAWVRDLCCRTSLENNDATKYLFEDVEKALAWLSRTSYEEKVTKWETDQWGEIPADYDRKR